MPRKAPTEVIEHRITLGDYERKEIKEALDVRDRQVMINNVVEGSKAVVQVGGLVAAAYIGYLGWMAINGLADEVGGPLKQLIFGKETYPTAKPPPENPDDWVNRDPETGERINPMHPVPFAGGLVGFGIQIGEAVPVGNWVRGGWDATLGSIFD